MKRFLTARRLLQDTDGNQVRADQIAHASPNGKLLPARDYNQEPAASPSKAKILCPLDGCCESFANAGNLNNHTILKHPGARLSVCLFVCLSIQVYLSVRLPVSVLVCMSRCASSSRPLILCLPMRVPACLCACLSGHGVTLEGKPSTWFLDQFLIFKKRMVILDKFGFLYPMFLITGIILQSVDCQCIKLSLQSILINTTLGYLTTYLQYY